MKKKLNKTNVGVLVLGIISFTVVIGDLLVITISTLMGRTAGWTWFGFITFGMAAILVDLCTEYLTEEYNKKAQKKRTK